MRRLIVLLMLMLLLPCPAWATTFYVDGNKANDTGNGLTLGTAKKYIRSGIALMSGGDQLIIADGLYQGASNMIGWNGIDFQQPPIGNSTAFTTIRSTTVGGVIIDGEHLRRAFWVQAEYTADYLHIDGIHFKRGVDGVFGLTGNHNWISNCGFEDGIAPASTGEAPVAFIAGHELMASTYNLVEDCWVWGRGRYGFYLSGGNDLGLGTNHNVFRRVVVRLDSTPAGRVTSGLRFYRGDHNAMQNCVVLDMHMDAGSTYPVAVTSGGGSSDHEVGHTYSGLIVLNNPQYTAFTPEDGEITALLENSVLWGNLDGAYMNTAYVPGLIFSLTNNAIGANIGYGIRSNYNYSGLSVVADKNLVVNNGIAFQDVGQFSNGIYYGNTNNTANGSVITSSSTTNPVGTVYKHLPRVESGTVGPRILYQIGGTGTFYGQTGWNATTTTPLWPFPNESLWATKMKAYNSSGVSPYGARGFANVASTTPLTDYLWGYLGTAKPDIYGGAQDGICGSASGGTFSSLTIASPGLCLSGSATSLAGTGPWTWGCSGSNGGASTASNACSALYRGTGSAKFAGVKFQ